MSDTKRNLKPLFWLGGILAAAGAVGGAVWLWNRDNTSTDHDAELEELMANAGAGSAGGPTPSPLPSPSGSGGGVPVPTGTGFPLRKGMTNNALVGQLQQALIQMYGAAILPDWGADKDFGSETERALISKGYPTVIDLNTFQQIISGQGGAAGSFDAADTARRLRLAVVGRKPMDAVLALRSINSAQQYVAANTIFKAQRFVHKSIVSVLIGAWTDQATKEQFRAEFRRIGLLLVGGIWQLPQLAGLDSTPDIMTTRVAVLWDGAELTVTVPAQTILGKFIRAQNGYTTIKAPTGQLFQVLSNAIAQTQR